MKFKSRDSTSSRPVSKGRPRKSGILATALTVLAAGLVSCGGNDKKSASTSEPTVSCELGTVKCENNVVLHCEEEEVNPIPSWKLKEVCSESGQTCTSDKPVCSSSSTTDGGTACNAGEYKCDDDEVLSRCEEGESGQQYWAPVTRCGLTNSLCKEDPPGCVPKDPEAQRDVCEELGDHKCKDNALFTCEEDNKGKAWSLSEECGPDTTCDAEPADCVPNPPPVEVCDDVRTVEFDCDDVGTTWRYSRGICGSTSDTCVPGGHTSGSDDLYCSYSNLCGNDNYDSPALWGGEWLSMTFNDVEASLTRLILTFFGRFKDINDRRSLVHNRAFLQIEELPTSFIIFLSESACIPYTVQKDGDDLISPATNRNIAHDGRVSININGFDAPGGGTDTTAWVSKMTITFCYTE